jgi:hypothetical protein
MRIALLVSIVFMCFSAHAQRDSVNLKSQKKVVQIAGIVVSGDSVASVPFAKVMVKGNYRGALCDFSGFFSIVANTGDTLVFSCIGYKRSQYIIPENLESKQYSLIQILDRDTILLPTTEIVVWPTYEQFKVAFLTTEVPNDDMQRAEKNLNREAITAQAARIGMGANANQNYMLENYKSRLYFAGQLPPNNLLNPIAWMKFIKAWKDGTLKNK